MTNPRKEPIPFEVFAGFKRIETGNPADTEYERHGASHPSVAIADNTIHIVYTGKTTRSFGEGLTMCHATAPTSDPAWVTKNPENPVFTGSGQAWDSRAVRQCTPAA